MATDEDEWGALRAKAAPQFETLLTEDDGREFDVEDQLKFFELLAEGYGPNKIGLSLGWSPAQVKRFTRHPDRQELMTMVEEAKHEDAERAIYLGTLERNATAMKLWAFCKMRHRGWSNQSQVEIVGKSQHEIVLSVREALDAKIGKAIAEGGTEAVAALQAGFLTPDGPAHDDDDDIVDAEVLPE